MQDELRWFILMLTWLYKLQHLCYDVILFVLLLTFHINRDGGRFCSKVILSCAEILSRVWRLDGMKGKLLSLDTASGGMTCSNLGPGVLCYWVGLAGAGQIHWTALLYYTRGSHSHWGGLWSVCWQLYHISHWTNCINNIKSSMYPSIKNKAWGS